ncbi:S66 peptidase family protein [Jiulongibacter sp. NS-SX5]|uniref:S66 peptidase family protein n=1 Tax=Jiulongibacter sp. NS-SX5 TaxID=3463854 RepID=UPI00405940EB
MSEIFKSPPSLKPGDQIGVISMASKLDKERFFEGKKILEEGYGFKITEGQYLFEEHFNFAGTDEQRLSDLQQMLDNPAIKAIIAGRGGYGTSRIIDKVDWAKFRQNPKWIVGFSDITALHSKVQSLGFQSIHGPMLVTMSNEEISTDSLIKTLTGEPLNYSERGHIFNREGIAKAPVIGGNLCLLAHNIGAEADISYDHKILFIEDIGEYYYNIDRMMVQLKRAGKLKNLAGLIVGQFSDSKENSTIFGKDAYEIIAEHTAEYTYPISFDFPIGHDKENRAIRCGEIMTLEVKKEQVNLTSTHQYV